MYLAFASSYTSVHLSIYLLKGILGLRVFPLGPGSGPLLDSGGVLSIGISFSSSM